MRERWRKIILGQVLHPRVREERLVMREKRNPFQNIAVLLAVCGSLLWPFSAAAQNGVMM